ncbi:MAG: DUF3987 domain-containing protein [Paludibacteraceae bacterium]|nr:DUF3987 domain-containing protein [Paludibacteraceae bacterium]
MTTRICYQEGVSKGQPLPLTKEKWDEMIDSPEVKNICQRIAGLDTQAADYNERKQALKKRLPVILPHAQSFKNGKRVSADATSSGLAMLDVDHVENPRAWFDAIDKQLLSANRIYLVAITASGKGLRIIGEMANSESIEVAQMQMASALGIKEYDAVTKDLARASFVVPREYVLWCDDEGLFSAKPMPASNAGATGKVQPALPAYTGGNYATERDIAEPASDAGLTDGELCYRGIPYKEIAEQLMVATGNAGGAIPGERNTVYFMLANYMRYICDFDAELLLKVLPGFGLNESERRQAINSAIGRPRRSEMPMVLQGAIAVVERDRSSDGRQSTDAARAQSLPLPEMPRLLRLLCRRLPEEYRAAMVIASLPVLGTLATRVRFEYLDRQEQSLSFFSCITAPAASGKSFIRKPVDLLLTPINEQDAIEREKEQAYKDKLRASKNSKNQPEDPHACPRNNGVSISIAKLLQLLTYAEGKHLIGIGEEMDTLVKSERAGVWSQKSDIYRLAFDNAEYGQSYMSDASFNAHIKVYYNLLLTGTPNSMKRFFKDLENGLATRVCFAQLPDTSFTEIPIFAPYTEAEKAEIVRWARQLDAEQGTLNCPQVGTVISEWLEKKRQQAIDADSHAMDTLRRRAAVIGFRAGMLCYLLENRKPTKTVGAFAEWVAEYVFRNQMELWGEQMELLLTGALDAQNERGAASSLLELLPQEFSTAELIKLRARKGQSVKSSAINVLLHRWKANGRIDKVAEGIWRRQ